MAEPSAKKLGLLGLIGMVAGSMVGGGIFNLPQNMAAGAAAGAVIIAWVITAFGMYFLANTFRTLSNARPDLSAGIYRYAQEGFGRFIGFEVAWGYWLSSIFGNVAFAVLFMQALGYFFPIFGDGKNWPSVIGGSALIWGMHFLVLRGVSGAAMLNAIATGAKLIPLAVMAGFAIWAFQLPHFELDFWGEEAKLGDVGAQVKSTMLVTLWAFIGIEGAVVVSGRAKNPALVGQATLIGLFVCLSIYVLISVVPFGVMTQQELGSLKDPSASYVLKQIVGNWGAIFMNLGVLLALLSCWLSWTILVAEVPHEAAKDGVFPRALAKANRFHSPAPALWMSSLSMQATIFVVLFAEDAWLFLLQITGVMVLPPYLASCAYLWKLAGVNDGSSRIKKKCLAIFTGIMGTLYASWLLYAAGPGFLLMSSVLFATGIGVYWLAHRDRAEGEPLFVGHDNWLAIGLAFIAAVAILLMATGLVSTGLS
ncbi:MAG: basic amino acid/polyamine antiporter [Pseudomonadota bacterium]